MRLLLPALLLALPLPAAARDPADAPPARRLDGLFPVEVGADGRILATLPAPDAEGISGRFLHATQLRTGLGSAPLGLDRGMFGPTRVLVFRRLGNKVAIAYEPARFRATNAPAAEQAAARDSFAGSVAWMADVVRTLPDGRVVVDLAPFLTRDAAGIAARLEAGGAKGFRQVDALSAADPASVKLFPDNLEADALLTFRSDTPGAEVSNIAPDPRQIGFTLHHSLVRLPGPGYRPRRLDPRVGGFGSQAVDFAAPLGQAVVYDLVNRFRLEKTDPAAARSPVRKPIVFHVDRAAPEPIRSALVDGVRWWADAFDRAGYLDAFRAEVMPADADPMDVRYNVVNWVNRATRGWSYGQVIADPRTGEIVRGAVLLGSLRVRQDMLIYEALVGTAQVGRGGPNDPRAVALARLRQLAAHEVGHALGFVHNFAASTQGRASVMDYPAPRIGLAGGKPDLSDAYGTGLGAWDRFAVDWSYGEPAPGTDPEAAAAAKAAAMVASGQRFVTDADARSADAAQPWGSLWDDGADPVAELTRMTAVRRAALANFGGQALHPGEAAANLRRKFVPVWLLHRYQAEAAAKLLGGVDFAYSVAGDARPPAAPVPAARQRAALDALMASLSADALAVPPSLVPLLSAGTTGEDDRQYEVEVMATAGGPVFDPLVAADTAATLVLDLLLQPQRLTRLHLQHAVDAAMPGPGEVLDRLLADAAKRTGTAAGRRYAWRVLLSLAGVARGSADPEVASLAQARLEPAVRALASLPAGTDAGAWGRGAARLFADDEALEKALAARAKAPPVPPGMPIGGASVGGGWVDD